MGNDDNLLPFFVRLFFFLLQNSFHQLLLADSVLKLGVALIEGILKIAVAISVFQQIVIVILLLGYLLIHHCLLPLCFSIQLIQLKKKYNQILEKKGVYYYYLSNFNHQKFNSFHNDTCNIFSRFFNNNNKNFIPHSSCLQVLSFSPGSSSSLCPPSKSFCNVLCSKPTTFRFFFNNVLMFSSSEVNFVVVLKPETQIFR